jgi:uncharacterized membrane protein
MTVGGLLLLPPPRILAEYEKDFPGLVDRIIGWTEEQRKHRQSLERLQTEGSEKRMNRGQLIAGGLACWGLTMAVVAGAGIAIAVVSIGGPTAAIWLARNTSASKSRPTVPQSPPETNVPESGREHPPTAAK